MIDGPNINIPAAGLFGFCRDRAVPHEIQLLARVDRDIARVAGPVLLAETEAPSEIVTDWPAARAMLPPLPEPRSVPTVWLNTPPDVPSPIVPEIEIVPVAWSVTSPPLPVLVVPLLMTAPLLKSSAPVLIDT